MKYLCLLSQCAIYFFCIGSLIILCTVHKVVYVTAKIIQSNKRGREKDIV